MELVQGARAVRADSFPTTHSSGVTVDDSDAATSTAVRPESALLAAIVDPWTEASAGQWNSTTVACEDVERGLPQRRPGRKLQETPRTRHLAETHQAIRKRARDGVRTRVSSRRWDVSFAGRIMRPGGMSRGEEPQYPPSFSPSQGRGGHASGNPLEW